MADIVTPNKSPRARIVPCRVCGYEKPETAFYNDGENGTDVCLECYDKDHDFLVMTPSERKFFGYGYRMCDDCGRYFPAEFYREFTNYRNQTCHSCRNNGKLHTSQHAILKERILYKKANKYISQTSNKFDLSKLLCEDGEYEYDYKIRVYKALKDIDYKKLSLAREAKSRSDVKTNVQKELRRIDKYVSRYGIETAIRKESGDMSQSKAAAARRKKAMELATPKWLEEEDKAWIKDVYDYRDKMMEETGVKLEVDHVVPIQSDVVCGLNVPWNMRVIHERLNSKKSNKLPPPNQYLSLNDYNDMYWILNGLELQSQIHPCDPAVLWCDESLL